MELLSVTDVNADNFDETSEENKCQQDNLFTMDKLKETLQPLYISLSFFGLTYVGTLQSPNSRLNSVEPESENPNDIEAQIKDTSRRPPKLKAKYNTGKYYCVFITVLLWLQAINYSRNLFTADTTFMAMEMLIPLSWIVLCASQQLIFFRANALQQKEKLSKFGKFVKELILVKADDVSDTKRQIKVIVLVAWVNVLMNIVTAYVALFQSVNASGESEVRTFLIGRWNKESNDIMTYIYLPIHAILSGVWMFSTANYVALTLLVAKRFDDVFQRASAVISSKKKINIASLRREHVQLCHVMSALDDMLSPSGLVSYAVYIPMLCILLNVFINTYKELSPIMIVGYSFWIVASITVITITSVSGAVVNQKVYSLSEVIYDINVNDLDSKSELELMLLISNLNSNSIGLTVGGLTTITKGMILTVFGTVVGYFTILIQFKK